MDQEETSYDEASRETVELGNRIADTDDGADVWEIADGLLAGAIQYWLYSRQPCGDPECEECRNVCTAELRLAELQRLVEEFARTSEYFHAPTDFGAGRA